MKLTAIQLTKGKAPVPSSPVAVPTLGLPSVTATPLGCPPAPGRHSSHPAVPAVPRWTEPG